MPSDPIPVVDLFAGPGGLGEGFSRVLDADGSRVFKTVISIEKDPFARQTLRLRAFYRPFRASGQKPPAAFFKLIQSTNLKERESAIQSLSGEAAWKEACEEIPEWKRPGGGDEPSCELGPDNPKIHKEIRKRLKGAKRWVLIGGPPCQAYSLVGRSRMQNHDGAKKDSRHFLYREYLKVITMFKPTIFVMENVKGLNTAKVNGKPILPLILKDLGEAGYVLKSIVKPRLKDDFLVKSELFGVPQTRHRVIIVGIRNTEIGMADLLNPIAESEITEKAFNALSGLPRLSALLSSRPRGLYDVRHKGEPCRPLTYECKFKGIELRNFISSTTTPMSGLLLNHEARSHMQEDLDRYKWWAGHATGTSSPKLDGKVPRNLLPNHGNSSIKGATAFSDRFKVQVRGKPCGTITSHISKDGHYYIHYDPAQARSFSVREAARIQTFPDDYFFMGNRTQQYHQVGNAVPPYLAYQIGQRVWAALKG